VTIASRCAKFLLRPLGISAARVRALCRELKPVLKQFQTVFLSYYVASLLLIFILYSIHGMLSQSEKDLVQFFVSVTVTALFLSPFYLYVFEFLVSIYFYDRFLRHSLDASFIDKNNSAHSH